MKQIFIFLLAIIGVAYGQSSPTSAKTRFVNGIYLGTKLDSYFNAADSNAVYWRADSSLMAKYKGTARALAFAVSGGYLPISDTAAMLSGYKTYYPRTAISAGTGISYNAATGVITNSSPSSGGTVTSVATSAPITGGTITSTGTIGITQSTTSTDGYLSATDWNTFNNKASTASVALKLNISDTASMLSNYRRKTTLIENADLRNSAITINGSSTSLGGSVSVGTVTSVAASAGTGISVTGSPITSSGTITITNTAPDQTVTLAAGSGISVTGTYPNFTVANTSPSSGGTVTSVSAGTGMSFTTITSSGAVNADTTVLATRAYAAGLDVAKANTSLNNVNGVLSSTYGGAGSVSGILKANGSGVVSAAVAGTDYVIPSALSSYVPYTGATTNVNLGSNSLTAGAITSGNITANAGNRTLTFDNITNFGLPLTINSAGSLPMYLQLNGSNVITLISTNVGIATTSAPTNKFEVKGDDSKALAYFFNNSGTAGVVNGVIIEAGTNSSDYSLDVKSSLGTSYFKVRGDGLTTLSGALSGTSFNFSGGGQLGGEVIRNRTSLGSTVSPVYESVYSYGASGVSYGQIQFSNSYTNNAGTGFSLRLTNVANVNYNAFEISSEGIATLAGALNGTSLSMSGNTNLATSGGGSRIALGTTTFIADEFLTIASNSDNHSQIINVKEKNSAASGTTYLVLRKSDDTYLGLLRRVGTDNALLLTGNSYLSLGSDNIERMRITSGGNLLIKTTTESPNNEALQVAGSGLFTSTLKAATGVFDNGLGRITTDGFSARNTIFSTTTNFAAYNSLRLQASDWSFHNGTSEVASISGSGAATFSSSVKAAGFKYAHNAVSSNYTLTDNDDYINVTSSCTITLPTAVGRSGKRYVIKCVGSVTATIASTSSQTINGNAASTYTFAGPNFNIMIVYSDGANWFTEAWASGN